MVRAASPLHPWRARYVNRLTEYVSFDMLMDELRKGKGADRGLNEYGKVNWPTNGTFRSVSVVWCGVVWCDMTLQQTC